MTRAESKEHSRQRLLEAARQELVEKGYGALAARQVSARAGLAQSSFYAHFRDKEHLVETLAEDIFSQFRHQLHLSRISPEVSDWAALVRGTVQRIYEFFLAERDIVALLFQELDQPGSPIGLIGQEIFDTLHQDFREDLTQLQVEGRIPLFPVEGVIYIIIGTATYLLRRMIAGKVVDPVDLMGELEAINNTLLRGILTPTEVPG